MLKVFLLCCLAATAVPAMATDEDDSSQYRGWCTRSMTAEKIPLHEREGFILNCMSTLVEADKNPDPPARKRKNRKGEEG